MQTTISEFVSEGPVPSVGPDDPVSTATKMMQSVGSDCVLVIENDQLLGIFTERDFLNRVAAEQRNPTVTPMREVMTPEPETLRPRDSIAYAINRMAVRGFRNIPIIDEANRVIAVIDVRDVMDHMTEVFAGLEEDQSAEEVDEWVDIGGGS